jgi:hypothetical protein
VAKLDGQSCDFLCTVSSQHAVMYRCSGSRDIMLTAQYYLLACLLGQGGGQMCSLATAGQAQAHVQALVT